MSGRRWLVVQSKSFDELPKQMREGGRWAQARLSSERALWPVGRNYYFRFYFDGCNCNGRASRGALSLQGAGGSRSGVRHGDASIAHYIEK